MWNDYTANVFLLKYRINEKLNYHIYVTEELNLVIQTVLCVNWFNSSEKPISMTSFLSFRILNTNLGDSLISFLSLFHLG